MNEPVQLLSARAAAVIEAIEASWSADTSATPGQWSPEHPATGQCEVSAFLVWQHFGGSLVLGEAHVDGVKTEHHHWNRIDGRDLDLTRRQFASGVDIRAIEVLGPDEIDRRRPGMRSDLAERLGLLYRRVAARLT